MSSGGYAGVVVFAQLQVVPLPTGRRGLDEEYQNLRATVNELIGPISGPGRSGAVEFIYTLCIRVCRLTNCGRCMQSAM